MKLKMSKNVWHTDETGEMFLLTKIKHPPKYKCNIIEEAKNANDPILHVLQKH